MTGTYPSFMATQDGRAILGRQPTLQDMLNSLAQGAPTSTGGYGGAPQGLGSPGGAGGQTVIGAGDKAMGSPYLNMLFGRPTAGGGSAGPAIGGGGRGIALPPGVQTPNPVPGQGVPTGAGGGGVGGAGGTAPGGIGQGQTGAESGQGFAAANAAVNPSLRSTANLASMVMSPLTSLPTQLLGAAFPNLNVLGNLLGLGSSGFNVKGPQLSPQQLNQLNMAYQQNPALAARLLATMRQQANIAGGQMGAGMLSGTGQTPMGSFGTMPGTSELTANFTSPGFGLNPAATGFGGYATWGGPGGGFAGGGGDLGGGGDAGSGGLGGGVGGGPAGGQNRSM